MRPLGIQVKLPSANLSTLQCTGSTLSPFIANYFTGKFLSLLIPFRLQPKFSHKFVLNVKLSKTSNQTNLLDKTAWMNDLYSFLFSLTW